MQNQYPGKARLNSLQSCTPSVWQAASLASSRFSGNLWQAENLKLKYLKRKASLSTTLMNSLTHSSEDSSLRQILKIAMRMSQSSPVVSLPKRQEVFRKMPLASASCSEERLRVTILKRLAIFSVQWCRSHSQLGDQSIFMWSFIFLWILSCSLRILLRYWGVKTKPFSCLTSPKKSRKADRISRATFSGVMAWLALEVALLEKLSSSDSSCYDPTLSSSTASRRGCLSLS